MRKQSSVAVPSMRLAELLGTFSRATDAGQGWPDDAATRTTILAVGLTEVFGGDNQTVADVYWLSLLRHAGCTAEAQSSAAVFEDKPAVQRDMYGIDYANPSEFFPFFLRRVARDRPLPARALRLLIAAAALPKMFESGQAICEVADRLAVSFGMGESTRAALFQVYERWNGKGIPNGTKGEAIFVGTRLVSVAAEAEIGHRLGGVDGAAALVRKRAGTMLDPALAECFATHAAELCRPLDEPDSWATFLAAEPTPHRLLDEPAVDQGLRALGDFTDLLSPWFRNHSSGVAALAKEAAGRFGLDEQQSKLVEWAGLVHDVGRVGVTVSVWDAPRPLSTSERERAQSHTLLTERILSRSAALAPIAELAALAHEQLDGKGYHRRLPPSALTPAARVLAASDRYHAMGEDRPHRPKLEAGRAARELRQMATSGCLDGDAVEAVVAAAGHAPRLRRPRPGQLTTRELEVLRLLARGLTNKEIATSLDMSPKTAGNHLQHIFEKLGVTTRAAATMHAMQRALL
jgi:HD-GYP domain-containing protein (c-di-GMP phosphodiesterase class II)